MTLQTTFVPSGRGHRLLAAAVSAVALAAALPTEAGAGDAFFGDWPSEWQVGGMAIVTPTYEGSSEYRVIGVPLVAPVGLGEGSSRFAIKGADDVRLRLFTWDGFEAGPLTGWRFGRDEDDGDRLIGMGDIDGGLVAGGYVGYRTGPLGVFASYHHQVTGDDTGGVLRLAVEGRSRLSERMTVTATAGTTWASDDYMQAFFGVSAAQAGLLPQYDADAGFKDVYIGLASDIALDDRWTLKLTGRYTQLIGDAADSPVVESESQLFGGVGLTYRFTWVR